jgi:hypothetical protein
MGSDTLSGTPGNQRAVAIYEVKSGAFGSNWEVGAPALGNGVMWLMATEQWDQPSNFAVTFYYHFINTGPAVTGATISYGVDNYGYIVLNGVKYPSTNGQMSLGYEGLGGAGSFTVNIIPPGLNTLELRVVNSGPYGNTTWQNQGILNGGPVAAWIAITSGSTILVKTTNKWRCTQFNYPAKFIGPVSLADVAENAGFSMAYGLAALAGKMMYDNAANATTLSLPVSLGTAIGRTFTSTTSNPLIYLQLFTNTNDTGSAASAVTTFGPVSFTTIAGKQCVYINNSANTYLSLNYIPSTRFTIAFWVYLIDTGDYTSSAIANVELTNSVLQFDFRSGEFQIPTALPNNPTSGGSWTLFPGISGATAGTWHFVAVSINQTNYEANYYLNGVLRVTRTGTGPLPLRAKIIIGRSGDNTRPFNGYIRKYFFFNSILSTSSINELYSQG